MRFVLLLFVLLIVGEAKKRSSKFEDPDESDYASSRSQTPTTGRSAPKHSKQKPESTKESSQQPLSNIKNVDDHSIEDVDEDKIDEILRDSTKNLVIFFYDGRAKCPGCSEALSEIEEIDDDIEATGYIEVVKTDDRNVARELGIATFPSLVYFRRKNPITYDGDFKDSEIVLRWVRSHDEVVTWDLTDDNFEDKTDSYSPDEGALDWFVMFYKANDPDCNAFVSSWETVAHKLRGLVNVGRLDMSVNDDVTERFRLDDDSCPIFLLLHRGKIYRYKEAAKDIKSLTAFATHKFKEQRGHRVPEPPTALEQFYEHIKEGFMNILDDSQILSIIGVGGLMLIVTITLFVSKRQQQQQSGEKPKAN